ncbi:hypothetical protein CURTO8I2_140010 [Curtobacterium sp. 8I-2]|nr:hypothetical protein CURTO8I2_140010 [Curtobacterium sp. 8I-2]
MDLTTAQRRTQRAGAHRWHDHRRQIAQNNPVNAENP